MTKTKYFLKVLLEDKSSFKITITDSNLNNNLKGREEGCNPKCFCRALLNSTKTTLIFHGGLRNLSHQIS